MSIYNYKAKSFTGEIKSGKLEAKDEKELANTLRQEGYILIYSEISRIKIPGFNIFSRIRKVSLVEKIMFCRHLSLMIKAGLSLSRGLEILAKQSGNKTFKKTILEAKDTISRGESFSGALEKYPKIFSELFCSMVKVGEEGGNLEEVLNLLAYQLEREHELNSRIRDAMIYPAIILSVMIIVGFLIMMMVMPRLTPIFEEMEVSLPWSTTILISITKFLTQFWYLIPIIGLAIVFFGRAVLKSKSGKKFVDNIFLLTPVLGSLVKKINIARTSRTLSSLMKSGVSILRALEVTSHTLGNRYYRDALNSVSKNLQKGKGLPESFGEYEKIYTVLFVQMVAVGSETGTLSDILKQLADFFEEEVSNTTKNLSTVIEPILLLGIGVVVAFFAISIIQAIYTPMMYIK